VTTETRLLLRTLPGPVRTGLAMLVLVLLGGFVASAAHLYLHHSRRDEQAGLSLDDLRGAYHGVRTPARIGRALERGHAEEMPAEDRSALLAWLGSDKVAQGYDNLDLGERAPAELIARNCLECHGRKNAERHPIARALPLDYWDDVRKLAFAKELNPVPTPILVVSTHTHALSLGAVTAVVFGMLLATGWPRRLVGVLVCVGGVGLAADLGGWWLARWNAGFVWAIIGGGVAYKGAMALGLLLVLADLVRPMRRGERPATGVS